MKLVIVESPAKAKTIGRFLGKDCDVVASYGHVRDLPGSAAEIPKAIKDKPWARMAVDIENDFAPVYVVQKDSKKTITELKKKVKEAEEVILATDEDREGESISWHLLELLKPKVPVKRIAFHEITHEAIDEAMSNPRDLHDGLVRAQESRRILDRLYGYSLSPVLWKKVRTKLSAGRVQSVAVRIVVEREEARRAFNRAAYWDVEAQLSADNKPFKSALVALNGDRLASGKDFDADTGELKDNIKGVCWIQEAEAKAIEQQLQSQVPWQVSKVDQKGAKQRPYPPFITSTLQQAASSVLGFTPRRTMQVAQRLYEGVDMGVGEREGLITYMRTDSVTLSNKALGEAKDVVTKMFGEEYHQWRSYSTKSKMAQEAHEAIRPTHLSRTPESVAKFLNEEERKLYRLIWNRTMASQMADANLLKTTVEFTANIEQGEAVLRANGSVVTFPGFLKVANTGQKDTELPPVSEGQTVGSAEGDIAIDGIEAVRHETQPPARFTEASLIKRLEEEGIGRPSTYAPTISLIQQRGYVVKSGSALAPTFLGIAVVSLLREHFSEYIDLKFTARMEDVLDNIADGQQEWVQFLQGFYFGDGNFGHGLKPQIEERIEEIDFPNIPLGKDQQGRPLVVRLGKSTAFVQRGEGGEGNTATIPDTLFYEDLTVEEAEKLIEERAKGNEPLGQDPETGMNIYAILGPYGPYVQLGETEKGSKPKRVSLPKGTAIDTVDMAMAQKYLDLPRTIGEHPESGKKITAAPGRFGPYIKCASDFRSLPDAESMFTITLDEAVALLAQPKGRGRAKKLLKSLGKHPESGVEIELYEGRYGPYVTDGSTNASLKKDVAVDSVTLEQAIEWLKEAANKPKRPRRKKAAAKKKTTAKKKTAAKKKAAAKKKTSG